MAPLLIEPLVAGRSIPSADRSALRDVCGTELADVGMAPRLAAQAALNGIRSHADGSPPSADVFTEAARLFLKEELDGESADQYVRRVALGTGLTVSAVRRAISGLVAEIRAFPSTTRAELPRADLGDGSTVRWLPAGRVFSAVMASNHPEPHASWVQALYHGYSVIVRPGSRDPFTARRLTAALLRAGLPPQKLAFLPCSHAVGTFLLREADRGIVYGGDDAVRSWQRSRSVAVRGPGRTRALLDVEPTDRVLDHLAHSAAFDAGSRCTNLSAVLTTGPVSDIAEGLAKRLTALPIVAATDPSGRLPVVDRGRAEVLLRQVGRLRAELTDHTAQWYAEDFVVELDDGSFLLRPVVLAADRADHPAVGVELPFPFLVVAPWSAAHGMAPLSPSLVLNLLTERTDILELAVRDPGVRKVTCGTVPPWTTAPGIPHDGNYTQFLLEPKGVVGAPLS